MYADELLAPWLEAMRSAYDGVGIFDCHTHLGTHDPSGFTVTLPQLLESVARCGARAVTFPAAEPEGYAAANRRCIEAAAASDGLLTAFVRLTPHESPDELLADGLVARTPAAPVP